MIKITYILTFLFVPIFCFSQGNESTNWTQDQIEFKKTFFNFYKYVENKTVSELSNATLFDNYIYFDNVLSDTSAKRKEKRIKALPSLLEVLLKTLDTVGVENLEVKPISFFEKDTVFFKPFSLQLEAQIPNVLAFYKKGEVDKPIGTILFEPKTHKFLAWVMIDQGGYYYYLTFNLL